jgi:two-component system osmolarity sensor histidine kinase EnvZ
MLLAVPLAFAMTIIGVAFFGDHWDRVQFQMSRGLAGEIAAIMKLSETAAPLARQTAGTIGINFTENTNPGLRPKHNDNERVEVGYLSDELARRGVKGNIFIDKPKRLLFVDVPRGGKTYTFATNLRRVYSSSTEAFLLWIFGTLLVVAGLSAPFIIAHAKSIRRIANAAARFGRGMSAPDFKPAGSREIREAGTALITMRERIDRYNRTRTDMLNAISHDLKSPLARMRLAIDTDASDKDKMLGDIDRMTGMINGYLAFARGEQPEIEQEISLAPMLLRIARDSAAAAKIKLNLPDESAPFYARPAAIVSAITNIVDNAARYAKKKIEITESDAPDFVELTIDDDGPGIAAELRADALRPFVRLDPARGADGGTGLGLSIAQSAIENHGGRLYLEDSPLGGLRVRVALPI